jgi:hypothetical protein
LDRVDAGSSPVIRAKNEHRMNKCLIFFMMAVGFLQCHHPNAAANKNELPARTDASPDIPILVGNIDTNKVIAQLGIIESNARLDLANEKIHHLSDKLDTLEFTYYFGFCDCQRWIVSEIHDQAATENPDLDELDPRGQVEFDLDEHGYYIEPASKDLEMNSRIEVNGTRVRLIGREYIDKKLPESGGFTVPNPPKGKVFRYYSFQIIRPYDIWGPPKFESVNSETGDTITEPTILTVR